MKFLNNYLLLRSFTEKYMKKTLESPKRTILNTFKYLTPHQGAMSYIFYKFY